MKKIRIGIDFGYKYTGIAVLDADNKVLDTVVIEHKNISQTLLGRRTNRSARRRKHTRTVRLRNFRALLKGMGVEPENSTKKSAKADKELIGNKLYALAHRRGWDYSSLVELLIDGDGKRTATVKEIDQLLIDEFDAPHTSDTKKTRGGLRTIKKIDSTCMGELAERCRKIADAEKAHNKALADAEKISNEKDALESHVEDAREILQRAETAYDDLHAKLDNADLEEIENYIAARLEKSGIAGDRAKEALGQVRVMLGLDVGVELHKEGKLYAPHKNRHRNEFVKELEKMMKLAFEEPTVKQNAERQARTQKTSAGKIYDQWWKNARSILDPNNPARASASNGRKKDRKKSNRDVRPARFQNRHVGKCPAQCENGMRCNLNLPKKSHADIRRLQFEVEARQMNIMDNGSLRKLRDDELPALLACVDFAKAILSENGEKWNAFFRAHKTPPVKDDARGKKEILKDIAIGTQSGRSGLCRAHLKEKLGLLKTEQTESEAWARLHQERMLSIYSNDAPPSIRQKVEAVLRELKKSLKKLGYDAKNPPIEHIGIESARFDISALAQNEGKKLKRNKLYQKRSSRSIEDLKDEQDGNCLYCGRPLGFADVDHIFARAVGGSDKSLNRAAAHDICNIIKNKVAVECDSSVLEHVKERNPKKYRYIMKVMENLREGRGVDDSLAGAQHTMFGAKLLKGSLIDAFGKHLASREIKNIFPKVNPREVDFLRKRWFGLIGRQKSALRRQKAAVQYNRASDLDVLSVVIGDTPKPSPIKWSETVAAHADIKLENLGKKKAWISCETTRTGQGATTTVQIAKNHVLKLGDEGVLSYRFNAIDKKTGECKQSKRVLVIISPAKDDPVREFHHAVDAIISAAKVDWDKVGRINHEWRTAHARYIEIVDEAADRVRPKTALESIKINGMEQLIAPRSRNSFFRKDKQDQSRPQASKTDTQALRVKDDEITQREALYKISEKNVSTIQSHRIKSLMLAAFADVKSKLAENKAKYLSGSGRDACLTQDYFMSLPETHPLRPVNTRNARRVIRGTSADQMFKIADPKNKGEHFYKRAVAWDKAVVYEHSVNGKTEVGAVRFKGDFYVNDHNKQTCLPDGAKPVKEFNRGDNVLVHGKDAVWKGAIWKISKLGDVASLSPQNDVAERIRSQRKSDVTSPYHKLTKLS